MSLLRILLGVLVGAAVVAGLIWGAMQFPSVAMFAMFGGGGAAFVYLAYRGVRRGTISARRSRYERHANTAAFWFYVSFYAFVGTLVFAYGVYCLVDPAAATA